MGIRPTPSGAWTGAHRIGPARGLAGRLDDRAGLRGTAGGTVGEVVGQGRGGPGTFPLRACRGPGYNRDPGAERSPAGDRRGPDLESQRRPAVRPVFLN